MKFIETKREELRRERIALNEKEWLELVQLLKGIGEDFFVVIMPLEYNQFGQPEIDGAPYLTTIKP